MSTRFLDTNILLRHLLNDDPIQSPAALTLIQAIEQGRVNAWTSDLVIAEVVFILANKHTFNLSRDAIRDLLLPLINLPGLKLPRKRLYRRIFDLYTGLPIDYIDCYHAALIERRRPPEIYSYDTDFDRIAGITRVEP
jgi:predicted nucleic acid-binding protein